MMGKNVRLCEWQTTKERRSHLINCWHLSEHESDVMWKLYSGNDKSIAIRSNLQRLIDSLKANDERVWIGQVEYEDFNNWLPKNRHFDSDNILQTFF